MSKNRHFFITVIEWGVDREPMTLRSIDEFCKDGWELPTVEDYEHAAAAGVKGFTDPDDTYWAVAGSGDIAAVVPDNPTDSTICNRYDLAHRVRLIRKMPSHVVTSHVRSKISKAKLIGK